VLNCGSGVTVSTFAQPSKVIGFIDYVFARRVPATKAERPWENESPHMNAAIPERKPATEEISGLIERVTFHNDESGFCIEGKRP
jgi:hypothetical protein